MTDASIPLTLPDDAEPIEHWRFRRLCTVLMQASPEHLEPREPLLIAAGIKDLYGYPYLAAAANALLDLWEQGWRIVLAKKRPALLPPEVEQNREREKQRIRRQEVISRNSQLSLASVQAFVRSMEMPHQHLGKLVSIFDLMRDGRDLARALEQADSAEDAIRPYIQIVDGSVDKHTGFRLHDIWRYFRHTWSNAYATVPGRSMEILIRDSAAPHHPVIGLAALSSAVVQIAQRDEWIGWATESFLKYIDKHPSDRVARWLLDRIDAQLSEIYTSDLICDGVLQPHDLQSCPPSVISALREDAKREHKRHQQATLKNIRQMERASWRDRAESPLFRSKRSAALAELIEIAGDVRSHLLLEPTAQNLTEALSNTATRKRIGRLVRHARGERVGTVIADLTVCGAIAPYNALAAGKLVGALAVSPTVVQAYKERYDRPSEIASAMAGREVVRESRLAFIGTTSLYSTGSSQYNRLFWPAEIWGGSEHDKSGFHELGRSKSFGTAHFSAPTIEAFVRLAVIVESPVRVNSVFGEGVSPRLRKVRIGLAALGWPANELLRHGRERIVYGVPLVSNLLDYSLGIDSDPDYLFDIEQADSEERIADWWFQRWASMRASRPEILDAIRANTLIRPVRHGARVVLPESPADSPDGGT